MAGPTLVIDTGKVCRRHLALCIDQDSREVVGLQLAGTAADAAAMALSNALVSFGIPETVVIDNGPDFTLTIQQCLRLGIGVERVTPWTSTAKLTERAFRDLRVHLDDLAEETP